MKKILTLIMTAVMLVSVFALGTSAANPWAEGKGQQISEEAGGNIDLNKSNEEMYKSLGFRFGIREGGKLVSFKPAIHGLDCKNMAQTGAPTFDFKVYKWDTNYATTVAAEPIVSRIGLELTSANMESNWYYVINLNPDEFLGGGEYYAEIDNVDSDWAIRGWLFDPAKYGQFLTYVDGEAMNNTLQWQLLFEDGNTWWAEMKLKDEGLHGSDDETTTAADTTTASADTTAGDTTASDDTSSDNGTTAEGTGSTAVTTDADTTEAQGSDDGAPIGLIIGIAAAVVVIAVVVVVVVKKKKK